MFATAYKIARNFTRPVIISNRFFDNSIECGCAAFIIINEDGWIMTAKHLWDSAIAYNEHRREIKEHTQQVQNIEKNTNLKSKQKKRAIKNIKTNPRRIVNHSFWWGSDGAKVTDMKEFHEVDLIIGQLDPFDSKTVTNYPTFKDPERPLNVGTSLCRLGYPFHNVNATFDERTNTFKLAPDALPIPLFPIEGIYTWNIRTGKSKDGKYDIKYLETSSPGLKGQSGGPIFDSRGTIWAIQSRTAHIPLGFNPKIQKNGQEIEEHQFINVGLGIHPELIVTFLKDNDIEFDISDY